MKDCCGIHSVFCAYFSFLYVPLSSKQRIGRVPLRIVYVTLLLCRTVALLSGNGTVKNLAWNEFPSSRVSIAADFRRSWHHVNIFTSLIRSMQE